MHVLVPVERRYTYADTREFCEIVAGGDPALLRRRRVYERGEGGGAGGFGGGGRSRGGEGRGSVSSGGGRAGGAGRTPVPGVWVVVHDGGRARARSAPRGSLRGRSYDAPTARAGIEGLALMGGTILWDVDTQVDFIEPGGKLYFPGAEEARPAMARLVEAARATGVVHVASCDQHELSDPEISMEPDYDSTWPPHCLLGTRGAEKIPETKQLDPLPL